MADVSSLYLFNPRTATFTSAGAVPAGNTVQNTAAETAFAWTGLIKGNSVQPGDRLTPFACGNFDVAATIPTLQGKVKLNSTTVLDTGAKGGLTSGTNLYWEARMSLLFTSTGPTGTLEAQGLLFFQTTGATAVLAVAAIQLAPVTIDTTIDQVLSLTAQWSAASTSNRMQMRQLYG